MPKRKHDADSENTDSLTQIFRALAKDDNALAKKLCASIRTLQEGSQTQVRALCTQWEVEPTAEDAKGKRGRRGMPEIRTDLHKKLKDSGAQYIKDHRISTRANTDGKPQGKPPIQQFELEKALADTAKSLKSIHNGKRMMIRVIDHAWSSPACISQRTVSMMQALSWDVNADFSGDQPLDACGYIAADAACALREAALANCNSWYDVQFRNYASLDCVERGNEVLHRQDQDRVLYGDDINRLVRRYSGIDQRRQAISVSCDWLCRRNPK